MMRRISWNTRIERATNVIAMDRLARELIDDEGLFESWLISGVADGDIAEYTTWDKVDSYYLEDDKYRELCELFEQLFYIQHRREYYESM